MNDKQSNMYLPLAILGKYVSIRLMTYEGTNRDIPAHLRTAGFVLGTSLLFVMGSTKGVYALENVDGGLFQAHFEVIGEVQVSASALHTNFIKVGSEAILEDIAMNNHPIHIYFESGNKILASGSTEFIYGEFLSQFFDFQKTKDGAYPMNIKFSLQQLSKEYAPLLKQFGFEPFNIQNVVGFRHIIPASNDPQKREANKAFIKEFFSHPKAFITSDQQAIGIISISLINRDGEELYEVKMQIIPHSDTETEQREQYTEEGGKYTPLDQFKHSLDL